MQQNWADVDENAEMNFSQMPSLPLAPLASLSKKTKSAGGKKSGNDPETEKFLSGVPQNGPFRIMVTRFPKTMTGDQLKEEFASYEITDARIEHNPGNEYCFLHFQRRDQCIQAKKLSATRIHGALIQLKISPSSQQQELRRVNRAQDNSNSGGRFNLRGRGGNIREPAKKHTFPVGGSIRPKRPQRQQISTAPKSNPWKDSGSRPRSNNENQQKTQILRRGQGLNSQSRNRNEDQNTPPQRRHQGQGGQRQQQRRDPEMNFRNRQDSSRAETSNNWRRSDTSKAPTRSPRTRTPETRKKTNDGNSRRQNPIRQDAEGFMSSRQKQPVQRTNLRVNKKQQEQASAQKRATKNAFALLDFDDE